MADLFDLKEKKIIKKNKVRHSVNANPLCNDCGKEIISEYPWGVLPIWASWDTKTGKSVEYYRCVECGLRGDIKRLEWQLKEHKFLLKAIYQLACAKKYPDFATVVSKLKDMGLLEKISYYNLAYLFEEMERD